MRVGAYSYRPRVTRLKKPYIYWWDLVGHPGLDPGTLGSGQSCSQPSLFVHLTWSEGLESSLASAGIPPNLFLRLHNWLHELDVGFTGVIRLEDSKGRVIETRIDSRGEGGG